MPKKKSSLGVKRKGSWRKKAEESLLDTSPEAPKNWLKQQTSDCILYICSILSPSSNQPIIVRSVTIKRNGAWLASIHGHDLHPNSPAVAQVPTNLASPSDVAMLLAIVQQRICSGNPDECFSPLAQARKGVFKNHSGDATAAVVEKDFPVESKTGLHTSTIRSSGCHLLVSGDHRCQACKKHRSTLTTLLHRHLDATESAEKPSSSGLTNVRYMNTPEKKKKIQQLRSQAKAATLQAQRLKEKLAAICHQSSVMLDNQVSQDILQLTQENSNAMSEIMPEGSPARLLWEQQLRVMQAKSTKGMRWHPLIVKLCLSLKLKSPAAYRTLRDSGFLLLPSERTLRDYTHHIRSGPGFHTDVEMQLFKAAHLMDSPPFQRSVIIAIDEMKVKQDLVFNKNTGDLMGFVDLGNADTALQALVSSETVKPSIASHMLVLMVRFLFKKLNFVYAIFPTSGATAAEIYSIVWEGIGRLEMLLDLKVLAVTCDGASTNRKFYRMCSPSMAIPYCTLNFYSVERRLLYLLCDVPHLMKTTRNCWANSFAHQRSRQLWINDHFISWQHLVELYEKGKGRVTSTPGLNMLHKLTMEHVYLTSYSKMKVSLAVQVLSKSVADALHLGGQPEVRETERFVWNMNKFFDLLNVRSDTEGTKKRNIDLLPYSSLDDPRYKWLITEFLPYLDEWERSVAMRQGFTTLEKNKMCLSHETLEGLRMTVYGFLHLSKYIFNTFSGVKYLLTERFTQDPLERFFGLQRQMGGSSTAPNVQRFATNTQCLRVRQDVAVPPRSGNSGRADSGPINTSDPLLCEPLPKRRKEIAAE